MATEVTLPTPLGNKNNKELQGSLQVLGCYCLPASCKQKILKRMLWTNLLLHYLLLQCISLCSSEVILDGNGYNEIKRGSSGVIGIPFAFLKIEGF